MSGITFTDTSRKRVRILVLAQRNRSVAAAQSCQQIAYFNAIFDKKLEFFLVVFVVSQSSTNGNKKKCLLWQLLLMHATNGNSKFVPVFFFSEKNHAWSPQPDDADGIYMLTLTTTTTNYIYQENEKCFLLYKQFDAVGKPMPVCGSPCFFFFLQECIKGFDILY